MTDVYDRAQQLDEAEREACVAKQRATPGLKATGYCLDPGCFKPLPKGQLFCGEECRDFYEKQERMRRITGQR
ncbi:MAG: hypothetical protein M0Z99_22365 [Betaproteobacteria bacterium]|nr:hypothetical protein [Betaproteobacteria bacterium]